MLAFRMHLTAVYVACPEGGYSAYIEEIPGVNTQGETMEETRENLADALQLVLETNRELARRSETSHSLVREPMQFAAA